MRECCECCIKNRVSCPVKDCDYWIDHKQDLNCCFIAVERNGPMTLREVGDRLNISFVRVKQIQDSALKKIVPESFDIKKFLENQ